MKLSASLLALFVFQSNVPSMTGFNQFSNSPSFVKTMQEVEVLSSTKASTDYLGKMTNEMQTVAMKSAPMDGQRVTGVNGQRIQQTERELEQRLARLAQTERALEQRLARLAQTERELQKRLTVVDLKRANSLPENQSPYSRNQSPYARNQAPYAGNQTPYSNKQSTYMQNFRSIDNIWESSTPTTVQGGSLRTWSYANPAVDRVHVLLKTDGRPLDADVELWHGPNNDPHKMKVYVEDGGRRTFCTFIDTPRSPNTIAIRNTGHLEFPMYACVGPDYGAGDSCLSATDYVTPEVIQGGALRTYPFEPIVDSVAVLLKTDGRPLNARIELLQGPNNNKQVLEVHTEDGLERPFIAVIQTPGSGNVVRVVNTAPLEFPLYAKVGAYEMVSSMEAYATDGIQVGRDW